MAGSSAPQADRAQSIQAIGSLIWKDPERILEAASQLRGSEAVIECRLRGASMGEAIPMGSTVRIRLGRSDPLRVGEVVAVVQDSGICVHRVAYVGRGQSLNNVITQGDACYYPDPPVHVRRVLGLVTEFHHEGRWTATALEPSRNRARSLVGRALLKLVAGFMQLNVPLAQGAARLLRFRKESGPAAKA